MPPNQAPVYKEHLPRLRGDTACGRGLHDNPSIGGIPTDRLTREALVEIMLDDCRDAARGLLLHPRIVVSSNGSVIARYHRDPEFRRLINQADLVDADGAPLVFASRLFCRDPLPERIATTDFIEDCCLAAVQNDLRFYFLGAKPGVAEQAVARLRMRYPRLQVVGVRDGYFGAHEAPDICLRIREAGTHVVWLAMGSPLQEQFAAANRRNLSGVAWIRTCGGLFDHVAGHVKRAPKWMQDMGLEWLHRMKEEPSRLGMRYLMTNPLAAYHLMTKTHD